MKDFIRDFAAEADGLFPPDYDAAAILYVHTCWYTAAGQYLESGGSKASILENGDFDSMEVFHTCKRALVQWLTEHDIEPWQLIDTDETIMRISSGHGDRSLVDLASNLMRLEVLQQRIAKFADEAPAGIDAGVALNSTNEPPSMLPEIVRTDSVATILFHGKTFASVDPEACDLLGELLEAYPERIGLTNELRRQPKRVTAKLPVEIQNVIHTNNKGSVLKP